VVLNQYEGHLAVRVFLAPRGGSAVVAEIDSGTEALCIGEWGEFVRVQWKQLEGWVGRKNVRLSPPASLSVSQFIPLRSTNLATSSLPSPKLGSFHAIAPDQLGDLGTTGLAQKLLDGGMQLAKDMGDSMGTGDTLMGTPLLALDVPNAPDGWAADSGPSRWTLESAISSDPAWATNNVDHVVEAMRISGSESMDAPSKGQTLRVPVFADVIDSPAPDEAKIQEAQSLLAKMLMPQAMSLRRWRTRRGYKHRRKSAPPPGETGDAELGVQHRRRALSTEAIAETDEVWFSPPPQPLQPLNGSMPNFPAIELGDRSRDACRQKILTPQWCESQLLLQAA